MNAEIYPIKTAAETALADSFAAVRDRLPGNGAVATSRARAFQRFNAEGLPHRRVEEWKYTDLRALMRDAKPLAAPPDATAKARAKNAGATLASIEARRIVFVDGAFVRELSDLAALEPGLSIRSMAQALAADDPIVTAQLGKVVPTDNVAVALNTAFMGDGAVIQVAAGVALARPIHLLFVNSGERPASIFVRSLVVIERGARAMLVESHEGCRRLPGERGARTGRWRRGACRPHQGHRGGGRHVARLVADGGDRRTCALQRIFVHHRRHGGAQPAFRALRWRGDNRRHPRREPAQGAPARRRDGRRRPCGWSVHQPGNVQDGSRRRGPGRLSGQDYRAARSAEDGRQDGDACAVALGHGRSR